MPIRIIDGTPKHDVPSLCLSCESAINLKTEKDSFTRCQVMGEFIREKITKCSSWEEKSITPLIYKTAWIYASKYNHKTDEHEPKTFHPPGTL